MKTKKCFNIHCTECARLADFLTTVKRDYPDYHAAPVPPFGDDKPELFIVGLAPGMHGANASGRAFTGDHAGILLYQTLYDFGFSNKPTSAHKDDDLILKRCRITNAVKCLPPQNKPLAAEIRNCNRYLQNEIMQFAQPLLILALGKIAHDAILSALELPKKDFVFGHANTHKLDDMRTLVDSYHCSRYNTNTRRLTEAMFRDVFKQIKALAVST